MACPDDRVTCPYHFSLRLFTVVKRSSYGPMAFPILGVVQKQSQVPQTLAVLVNFFRRNLGEQRTALLIYTKLSFPCQISLYCTLRNTCLGSLGYVVEILSGFTKEAGARLFAFPRGRVFDKYATRYSDSQNVHSQDLVKTVKKMLNHNSCLQEASSLLPS